MEVIVCCNGRVSPGKGGAPGLGSPNLPHLCDSKAAGSLVPIRFLFRDLESPFSYFPLFLRGCSLRVFELQLTQTGFLSAAKAFGGVLPCPWPEQHGGSAPAAVLLGSPWLGLVVPSALAAANASRAAAGGAVCAPNTSPGLGVQLCPCRVPAILLLCYGLCRDACLIPAGWAALASTRCVPALLARLRLLVTAQSSTWRSCSVLGG